MKALTYDEYNRLLKKLTLDSEELKALAIAISLPASIIDLIIKCLYQIYVIRSILKTVDKLIKYKCIDCDYECNFEIKKDLETIVKSMKSSKELKEEVWFIPSLVTKLEGRTIEELEDKIENYWIASDKEIKELTNSISSKIKKMHAIH
ncbi:MAG: hypothetical protein ACE5GU_15215 [Candidatus Scalinduaceae bacterium]